MMMFRVCLHGCLCTCDYFNACKCIFVRTLFILATGWQHFCIIYIHSSPLFLSTMTLQRPVGNSLNLAKTLKDEGIKL